MGLGHGADDLVGLSCALGNLLVVLVVLARGVDRRSRLVLRDLDVGRRLGRSGLVLRDLDVVRSLGRSLGNLVGLLNWGSLLDLVGRRRSRNLVGGGLGVGHPGKLGLLVVRMLSGAVDLDGMVVLTVLIDTAVNTNVDGRSEVLTTIGTRGTTLSSATTAAARNAVRGVGTAPGTTVGDIRTRATIDRSWVDVGVLDLDRVVILCVLVDAGVGVDGDGHVEGLTLVISGRTTQGGATVVRSPVTLVWSFELVDRLRVNNLVLDIDGVVILVVFVHMAVDISGDRTTPADSFIITRGATKGCASRSVTRVTSRAVATTSRSAQSSAARSGALHPIGVVVVLNDAEVISVEVPVVVAISLVERRGTTKVGKVALHPIGVVVVLGDVEVIAIEVVVVVVISLVERRGATGVWTIEVRTALNRVLHNMSRRTLEVRTGVGINRSNNGRSVNVLVLDIDRVVILGRLIHFGVEVASDGHVEGLALIVARRSTLSSATGRPAALERERTSTRAESRAGVDVRWVDISVLDLDRVIILAELVHIGVSVDAGSIGNIESAVLVIS